ncbi:hypothetical protein BDA99DRAFT_491431 [Phascolomyces articulosus]|uniref:Uncharacterized protein n=1 Tax=Phascolomyces articulosus TaxID=60185 RepID=A0AAD5KBP1_9FUNG|nr:hypothetical protein BDA99DRAFT_491431 [Phascolomyces articulosus]
MIPLKPNPSETSIIHHIRSSLRACFKGKSATIIDSLVKAIVAVTLGLRVAHLIDVAHVTSDQINQLIILLRQEPQCQPLIVLQFKDRYTFLCHRYELEQHVETTLTHPNQWVYINVRGKQGPPSQHPCPDILLSWLQQRLKLYLLSFHEQKQPSPVYYSSVVPCYMVVLTGFLLEYPILYMTHEEDVGLDQELDEWEMVPNCLGDRSLVLTRLWLHEPTFWQDYMLMSFTCPEQNDLPEQHPTITTKSGFETKFRTRLDRCRPYFTHTRLEISRELKKLDRVAL